MQSDETGRSSAGRVLHEALERSSKAGFDAMSAALAHELNQPLAALTLYLQSLRRHCARNADEDPLVIEYVDKASREAERAGDIVRRMRRLSLRAEPERQIIDLNALAMECAEAAMDAVERRIEFSRMLDPNLPKVLADPVQIRQVVVNLVRNAAEAVGPRPEARIVLATEARNSIVRLTVSDNGPGISDAMAGRLFRAFETSKSEGMGLGLAISRMIAQNHGGELALEPGGEGGGACFELRLPIRPESR